MKPYLYLLFVIFSITSCDYLRDENTMESDEIIGEDEFEEENATEYSPFVDEEWIIRALDYQKGDSLFPLISDFTDTHTQDMASSPNPDSYDISFKFDRYDLNADDIEEYVLEITYSDSSLSSYKWTSNRRLAIITEENDTYEIIFDNNNSTETSIDDFELYQESTGQYIAHIRASDGAKKSAEPNTTGDHSFFRIIDNKSEHVLGLLSQSDLRNSYLDHDFNLLDVAFKQDFIDVHYIYSFQMHINEVSGLKTDTGRFVLLESDEIVRFKWDKLEAKYIIHSAETLDKKKLDFFYNSLWDPGYHQGNAVFIAFEDELRRQYNEAREPRKSGIKHALDNYDFF
jgi:hypothetical protein